MERGEWRREAQTKLKNKLENSSFTCIHILSLLFNHYLTHSPSLSLSLSLLNTLASLAWLEDSHLFLSPTSRSLVNKHNWKYFNICSTHWGLLCFYLPTIWLYYSCSILHIGPFLHLTTLSHAQVGSIIQKPYLSLSVSLKQTCINAVSFLS